MDVSGKDLERVARRLGFVKVRHKGSHAVYARGNERVVIPLHAERALKPKTLASIL